MLPLLLPLLWLLYKHSRPGALQQLLLRLGPRLLPLLLQLLPCGINQGLQQLIQVCQAISTGGTDAGGWVIPQSSKVS
jgi:hypothetical protein